MCPRKDIEGAVGYVSLKPTIVATDRSRSARGVAHPFPCRAYWQRYEWHPSLIWGGHKAAVSDLHRVRHTHSFFFLVDCFYRTDSVRAQLRLSALLLLARYGSCMDTRRAAPPYSLWFSVRYGCRKCRPVTALWQLMAVPLFLPLPFCHEFNPLTIASLGRVVAGLNRCGTFRIQQQVLHSDAGNCVPVFLIEVPLLFVIA